MKKFLSLLMVIALGATFTATIGCGDKPADSKTKK